jgi:hypothetical protein
VRGPAAADGVPRPDHRPARLPELGGAGNASAFRDERWDLYLPLLCAAWIAAVLIEQFLPPARRGPEGLSRGVRALAAALVTVTASCCGVLPLTLICH